MLVTDSSQSRYVRPVPGERVLPRAQGHRRRGADALRRVRARGGLEAGARARRCSTASSCSRAGRVRLDLCAAPGGLGRDAADQGRGQGRRRAVARRPDRDAPSSSSSTSRRSRSRATWRGPSARWRPPRSTRCGSTRGAAASSRRLRARTRSRSCSTGHREGRGFAMAWTRLAEAYADARRAARGREPRPSARRRWPRRRRCRSPQRYQIHAVVATGQGGPRDGREELRRARRALPRRPRRAVPARGHAARLGQQPEAIAAYQQVVRCRRATAPPRSSSPA